MTNILKPKKHTPSKNQHLLSHFHLINGEALTHKDYLLGLELHSITEQKKILQILKILGHCISYTQVMDTETAQAQTKKIS